MEENKTASKKGGGIAKKARLELEDKTGKSVISGENFYRRQNKNRSKPRPTKDNCFEDKTIYFSTLIIFREPVATASYPHFS